MSAQDVGGMIILYLLSFIYHLFVGQGSLIYYTVVSNASKEALARFYQHMPALLTRIYDVEPDEDFPSAANRRWKGAGYFVFGLFHLAIIIVTGSIALILSQSAVEKMGIGVFIVLELLTTAYFLTLGRKIQVYQRLIEQREKPPSGDGIR